MLEALESFDAEPVASKGIDEPDHARDKASTPSQEIIQQTKASWKEQTRHSKNFQEPISSSLDASRDSPKSKKDSLVHGKKSYHARTSSHSLWSDLETMGGTNRVPRSTKRSTLMSHKLSEQRQTKTFHGVPSDRQSYGADAKARANGTSQRLQAILGVDSKRGSLQQEVSGKSIRSPTFRKNAPQSPVRASTTLPVHDRRESSVYGLGGPMTPPPTSPLPAIPTSESQISFRTSSTDPLVLYTPISPAATVSTSANHWSWRLQGPDSPGSQLLNDMKNATDISKTRRTGETLPTKHHVHQRSISSSLSSAAILESTVGAKTVGDRANGASGNGRAVGDADERRRSGNLDVSLSEQAPGLVSLGNPVESYETCSSPALDTVHDLPDPNATSNSAGSPSSIVNLYMSRSQHSLVANGSL